MSLWAAIDIELSPKRAMWPWIRGGWPPVAEFFLAGVQRKCLHPWHRHDLDDFYPRARHLEMGMVIAKYLCGRIMRFGLHNRIAADLIFCI
jgi:hypothetical protein